MMDTKRLIQIDSLSKSYKNISVLKDVNLDLFAGEIHVVLGQNATGKSTLIKLITDIEKPDSGSIYFENDVPNGEMARNKNYIFTLYQDIQLFGDLTVKENLFFDVMPGVVSNQLLRRKYDELAHKFNIQIKGDALVRNLEAGERRIIELIRAYANNPKIVLLDEPNAYFTDVDNVKMLELIRYFRSEGKGILYITHKIDEAIAIADRISVMYDGTITRTYTSHEFIAEHILSDMVGKETKQRYPKIAVPKGKPIIRLEKVSADSIKDINFSLYEGEILGITGVVGCGKTNIGRAIIGAERISEGAVYYKGSPVAFKTPADSLKKGIGFIAEEHDKNLISEFSAIHNISLSNLKRASRGLVIDQKKEEKTASALCSRLLIKTPRYRKVKYLSGGNKQKVCLARLIFSDLDVLIIDEPTKGVDIPSKVDVYNLFNEIVFKKKAIILISSDFSEVCGMCDRVIVINKGQLVKEFARNEATEEKIIYYATSNLK